MIPKHPELLKAHACYLALIQDCDIPSHMVDSVLRYVLFGACGGSFLRSVLENNLCLATQYADSANRNSFRAYCTLLCSLPRYMWGSPEVVQAWADHNGLAKDIDKEDWF